MSELEKIPVMRVNWKYGNLVWPWIENYYTVLKPVGFLYNLAYSRNWDGIGARIISFSMFVSTSKGEFPTCLLPPWINYVHRPEVGDPLGAEIILPPHQWGWISPSLIPERTKMRTSHLVQGGGGSCRKREITASLPSWLVSFIGEL